MRNLTVLYDLNGDLKDWRAFKLLTKLIPLPLPWLKRQRVPTPCWRRKGRYRLCFHFKQSLNIVVLQRNSVFITRYFTIASRKRRCSQSDWKGFVNLVTYLVISVGMKVWILLYILVVSNRYQGWRRLPKH